MQCPCGSKENYSDCCGKFIAGTALPTVPEQLMRSRFTAYALGHLDYIQKTMRGKAAEKFDLPEALLTKAHYKWLDLKIIAAPPAKKDKAFVEFSARYFTNGKIHTLHENSEFQFYKNQWYYVDGKHD